MTAIELPAPLQDLALRPLFALELTVAGAQAIGGADDPHQRVGPITTGRFEGERLNGRVLPGGSDWQTVGADGAMRLDARLVLETDAGELIGMTFGGIRRGPPELMARLARGEPVDPADYYFRIFASFSAASPALSWLPKILAVGTGHRRPGGPVYNLFEVG